MQLSSFDNHLTTKARLYLECLHPSQASLFSQIFTVDSDDTSVHILSVLHLVAIDAIHHWLFFPLSSPSLCIFLGEKQRQVLGASDVARLMYLEKLAPFYGWIQGLNIIRARALSPPLRLSPCRARTSGFGYRALSLVPKLARVPNGAARESLSRRSTLLIDDVTYINPSVHYPGTQQHQQLKVGAHYFSLI